MRTLKLTLLALALATAFPSLAADPTPAETKKELDALKARLAETQAELNRIVVKTEAMEDARDESGLKGFKVSGYLDLGYHYNVNKERGSFQFLVPNSEAEPYGYDNSYFGSVALTVEKETESGAAFKLTLIPTRSTGDFIGGANIVHEATVSIPVEAIGGKIFAGQVPDWSGYEYLPPTQNKLITHNLLFDFTLPFVYTGVGVETSAGDWTLKAMVANVNTPLRQLGENLPVFVCRGDMEGSEFWGIGFACLAGKKTNFNGGEDTLALTAELDGWYTRGDLTLNAQVSYGQQEKASITPDVDGNFRDAQWIGASVLAAYKVTPRTELILRGDYIYNQKNGGGLFDWTLADPVNGLGPDPAGDQEKGTDRYAITAGLGYQATENVVLKAEYRYDGATEKVFGNKDALLDPASPDAKYLNNNSLISGSIVFSF
jgi:opacity protein-like surface antigen